MALNLVAGAPAFLLLDDVAGIGKLGDDSVGAALGDVQRNGDVTQTYAGVMRYADQREARGSSESSNLSSSRTLARHLELLTRTARAFPARRSSTM
jgi:hypothetical protein